MDHLDGAGFAVGREGAVNIGLAESFSEVAVCSPDASAPTRLLLLGSGQSVREEVEVLIDQSFVQVWCCAMNHLPTHIGLPVIERLLVEQLFQQNFHWIIRVDSKRLLPLAPIETISLVNTAYHSSHHHAGYRQLPQFRQADSIEHIHGQEPGFMREPFQM